MATVGNCTQATPDWVSVNQVRAAAPVSNRFYFPSIAWGFCTAAGIGASEALIAQTRLHTPHYINSALVMESPYMELILGQIWPRG